jgi:hypothetical protein
VLRGTVFHNGLNTESGVCRERVRECRECRVCGGGGWGGGGVGVCVCNLALRSNFVLSSSSLLLLVQQTKAKSL